MTDDLPRIAVTPGGPFIVTGLKKLVGPDGRFLKTGDGLALCRCGASKKKPFCDGSHGPIGFTGEKSEDRLDDRTKEYTGKSITVLDTRLVCSHDGTCITELPQVFSTWDRPWIQPDKAVKEAVIDICQRCPSGALSYKLDGVLHDSVERSPSISVIQQGPLEVVGRIKLEDPDGCTPRSKEHYCLCRCGLSTNQPFCDGGHFHTFDDLDDPGE